MLDNNIKQEPIKGLLGMGGGISIYYGGIRYDDPSSGKTLGTGWVISLDGSPLGSAQQEGYATINQNNPAKVIDVYNSNVKVLTSFIDWHTETGTPNPISRNNQGVISFNSSTTFQSESGFWIETELQYGVSNQPKYLKFDSSGNYYMTLQGKNRGDGTWHNKGTGYYNGGNVCQHAFKFTSSNAPFTPTGGTEFFKESWNATENSYGGNGSFNGTDLFVATTEKVSSTGNIPSTDYRPGVFKVSSDGALLSSLIFEDGTFVENITSNSDNVWITDKKDGDVSIAKLSTSNLTVAWRYTWDSTRLSNSTNSSQGGIACDSSDNIYVAGRTEGNPWYALLRKIDRDGDEQWARKTGSGQNYSYFTNVEVGADGFIYALGATSEGGGQDSNGNYLRMGLIQKYSPDGTLNWSRRIGAPNMPDPLVSSITGLNVVAVSIAIDPGDNNNIYVYCETPYKPLIVKLPTGGTWTSPLSFGGIFNLNTALVSDSAETSATRSNATTTTVSWDSTLENSQTTYYANIPGFGPVSGHNTNTPPGTRTLRYM